MIKNIENLTAEINAIDEISITGRVTAVKGLLIECEGIEQHAVIGGRCQISKADSKTTICEVIGFKNKQTLLMSYDSIESIGLGSKVKLIDDKLVVYPTDLWLGRVINANAIAIDDQGYLAKGNKAYQLKSAAPSAHQRQRVGAKMDTGIKAINSLISCCYGQRMGIFAGSGVGKSVLISMLAKYAASEVKIIGLVGERGREVQEFIHQYLTPQGLKNAVVIVATGDESALMRRQAAYLTLTIAEYFRDQGKDVLCIIDNITRFAMAQREIGLSCGEAPSSKGYTPTVFSELPQLLERAGPGVGDHSITGLFAVLVEGDDHNEPIADAVRGILDGHIILERSIAERGRYPAINLLKSVSRVMPHCNNQFENDLVKRTKSLLSTYEDMAEMIRLGAYKSGSNKLVDEAIFYYPKLEDFFTQAPKDRENITDSYQQLAQILDESFV